MEISLFFEALTRAFNQNQSSSYAEKCGAYMKNIAPFFGVSSPKRKELQKPFFLQLKSIENRTIRWEIVRECWLREEREFQYFAIDWINTWPSGWYNENDDEELEWLLSNKSWWDSVDAIASNYLGKWAKLFPEKATKTWKDWRNEDECFWLQRSCLIFQLKYKNKVDFTLLESLIVQFLPNKEFFIQKAIGWSLRQYSKFNPKEVQDFLERTPVSGLALREAKKYLSA